MKETLANFKIGGFEHEFCIVDFDFLKSLKKHPKNRPSGDIDDDIAPYLPEEILTAKSVTKKLYNRFLNIGFDPNVKTIVVGNINGVNYKLDGQHTIGAIRQINDKHPLMYNEFKCEIIKFGNDEVSFLKMLEKYNNLVTKYKPQDYAHTSPDNEVNNDMVEIASRLGITGKLALTIMYGNLSSNEYENLTIDRTKKNYKHAAECMGRLFDAWDGANSKQISDLFRKGDVFIVFNELIANIFHKTYLKLREHDINEASSLEYVKGIGEELIQHMIKIDTAAFLLLNEKNPKGATRKKFYKKILKHLLLNRSKEISKEYADSVKSLNGTELKDIIEEWAESGKNSNNGANKEA